MVACCGYGSTPLGLFTVLIPCAPMYLSSWEQYHTGVLYLGYFNGPCEGIIIACLIMALSAIYGPQFYHQNAVDVFGWPFTDPSIHMQHLFVGLCLSALFFVHIPGCFWNVYQARKNKGLGFLETLPQLTPIVLFFAAYYAWLLSPYSQVLERNGLMRVGLIMTFVFGRMTTKIILVRSPINGRSDGQAHLTKQPFPYFTNLLIPLFGIAFLINVPYIFKTYTPKETFLTGRDPLLTAEQESLFVWVYLAFATVEYFRWAFQVIDRICKYLDINCLTIKKTKKET